MSVDIAKMLTDKLVAELKGMPDKEIHALDWKRLWNSCYNLLDRCNVTMLGNTDAGLVVHDGLPIGKGGSVLMLIDTTRKVRGSGGKPAYLGAWSPYEGVDADAVLEHDPMWFQEYLRAVRNDTDLPTDKAQFRSAMTAAACSLMHDARDVSDATDPRAEGLVMSAMRVLVHQGAKLLSTAHGMSSWRNLEERGLVPCVVCLNFHNGTVVTLAPAGLAAPDSLLRAA